MVLCLKCNKETVCGVETCDEKTYKRVGFLAFESSLSRIHAITSSAKHASITTITTLYDIVRICSPVFPWFKDVDKMYCVPIELLITNRVDYIYNVLVKNVGRSKSWLGETGNIKTTKYAGANLLLESAFHRSTIANKTNTEKLQDKWNKLHLGAIDRCKEINVRGALSFSRNGVTNEEYIDGEIGEGLSINGKLSLEQSIANIYTSIILLMESIHILTKKSKEIQVRIVGNLFTSSRDSSMPFLQEYLVKLCKALPPPTPMYKIYLKYTFL